MSSGQQLLKSKSVKKVLINITLSLFALLVVTFLDTAKEQESDTLLIKFGDMASSETLLGDIEDGDTMNICLFDDKGVCRNFHTYTYKELKEKDFEIELSGEYRDCKIVVQRETVIDQCDSLIMISSAL